MRGAASAARAGDRPAIDSVPVDWKHAATPSPLHFTDRFPLVKTACGRTFGPCSNRWRDVTCLACLDAAPADPRIEALKRRLRGESD